MTIPKMRRFYFQIPDANVIECIWAHSFTDAKAKAALTWLPWWNQIEWLNVNELTELPPPRRQPLPSAKQTPTP